MGLDSLDADTDGDGATDYVEAIRIVGYNPSDLSWNAKHSDSDSDGLNDGYELLNNMDPSAIDSDFDGVFDDIEVARGTSASLGYDFPHNVGYDMDLDGVSDYSDWDRDGDHIMDSLEVLLGLDPTKIDTDGDGLSDRYEATFDSDPRDPDTDDDGFTDGEEYQNDTGPRDPLNSPGYEPTDTDGDGLADGFETDFGVIWGSLPNDSDSDDDGLLDDRELSEGTQPDDSDTDNDGLSDGDEVSYESEPLLTDTDYDGASDALEFTAGTELDCPWDFPYLDANEDGHNDFDYDGDNIANYYDSDDDNDGIQDEAEVILGTNPLDSDTDDDGISDGRELNIGSDPKVYTSGSLPQGSIDTTMDSDNDGVPNYIETQRGTDPNDSDSDNDGLSDGAELGFNSPEGALDPLDSDTDNDGLTDGQEVLTYFTSPYAADDDRDGLSDRDEVVTYSTSPYSRDSDSDGLDDGPEVWQGSNPLSPDSDGDTHYDLEDAFPNAFDSSTDPNDYGSRDLIRSERYYELEMISGLRQDIQDMLTDIAARQQDYLMDKISDAQMHKVMTDKNGYRVRVEEYVFRPASDQINLMNICLRTSEAGPYAGLTTLNWQTVFNTSLDGLTSTQIRNLPWDDYLSGSPNYGSTQPAYYPSSMLMGMENPATDLLLEKREYSSLSQSGGNWLQDITLNQISIDGETFEDFTITDLGATSFRYTSASTQVDFDISVIDAGGNPVSGSFGFDNLWDVLGANMFGSSAPNYVGNNFVEIDASSSDFMDNIDLVYIPAFNLRWRDDFSWEGAR